MFSLFGSNRPFVLSFLILPAVAVIFCGVWYGDAASTGGAGPIVDYLILLLKDYPGLIYLFGVFLNLGSAILLNAIYNKHDFALKENYFPALLYFLFSSLHLEWAYLNPILMANLFLLLALRRLLEVFRTVNVASIGFDSGFFLGVAVLCFPPVALCVPVIWLCYIQLRPFNLREWLVPFSGLGAIALYAFTFYYWMQIPFDASEFLRFTSSGLSEIFILGEPWVYIFSFLSGLLFLFGIVGFIGDMGKSTLRKKNSKALFLWLFLLLIISYLYVSALDLDQPGTVLLFSIPFAVVSGFYLSGRVKKFWTRLLFYTWIASAVGYFLLSNSF